MSTDKIIPAWERQPGDTDESWHAFVAFRDAKPPRRLLGRPGTGPTVQLSKWYREGGWRERAAAYDAYMDHVMLQEREDFLRQTAKDISVEHMQVLQTARSLVQRELDKFLKASQESEAIGMVSPGQLNAMMENMVKLDRLVRDQSTENVETGMDLSQLSVEELKALKELSLKARQKT